MNRSIVARIVTATRFVAIAGAAGLALALGALPAQAQEFGSPELIAAAKKEGKLVYYTAEFRRGRAGGHQGVQQALSRDQDRDGARARRPAHHPHQDRGRRRQAVADVVNHSDRA